jgi:transposase
MKITLGVDIAKDKFDCCLLVDPMEKPAQFPNTPRGFKQLLRWLAKEGAEASEILACMEATGIYGEALLAFLHQAHIAVSKVNPAQIKHYSRSLLTRNKTDRLDARVIAQFARERFAQGRLRLWSPPRAEVARLRALNRLLMARKEQCARERRRAAMVPKTLRKHTAAMLRSFARHIAEIQAEIDQLIAACPELARKRQLLCSIPCVGPVTAQTVLAELPEDIASARAAAAYAGLTPERQDSGKKQGPARLSKTGNPHLRRAFYMPAVVGRKHNKRIQAQAERLQERGLANGQIIGAGMHLLLRLCYGVMASGQPFDPHWQEARPKSDASVSA